MFYIFTKFYENICNGSQLQRRPVSTLKKIINRQISVSNVGEVKVPVLCILPDDALYFTKFHEAFIATEWT